MAFFGLIKDKPKQQLAAVTPTTEVTKQSFSRYIAGQNNQYDFTNPIIDERVGSNGIVWFAEDNLYPQLLNQLYYASPLHASIINFKCLSIAGNGYKLTFDSTVSEMDRIRVNQFEKLVDGQKSLQEFIEDIVLDLMVHGRITIKVDWNEDHTKINKLIRIAPEKIRYYKKEMGELRYVAFNEYWRGLYGDSYIDKIPTFDVYRKDEPCQVYCYGKTSPGLNYYTQPIYANAANWIYNDGQTSYWHKQNILNSVNPSMVIQFFEKPANQQEMDDLMASFKHKQAGPVNRGKLLTTFSENKETAPNIIQMNANALDDTFTATMNTIVQNICFAHSTDPVVIGLSAPGALGQSQQLETAYQIFQDVNVTPNQKIINELINKFITINKLPVKFELNAPAFAEKLEKQQS